MRVSIQTNRKLMVFDRKLDGGHSLLGCYFDILLRENWGNNVRG